MQPQPHAPPLTSSSTSARPPSPRWSRAHVSAGSGGLTSNDALWGWALLIACLLALPLSLYAILLSKLLPPTGYALLDAVRDDHYYVYLVPLTLPAGLLAVYAHWTGLHLFKHN